MKEKIKFLFQDKQTIPVFVMCAVMHIFIFWWFQDFFTMPVGWIILVITLCNIGVTLCVIAAIKKWKGGKK